MRARQKKRGRISLLKIFVSITVIFLLLWLAVTAGSKLLRYGEAATISAPEPEAEPEQTTEPEPEPEPADPLAGLPKNSYDHNAFYEENGLIRYSGQPEGKVGIDVSSHQGEIDWAKVKAAGVDFAMIRLGYRGYTMGEVQEDEYFVRNMDGALAAGLDVGVYFFSQAISQEEALEEADFVLDRLGGYPLRYPVIFDWEDIEAEARTDSMDMPTLTTCAYAFCQAVEAGGYRAGVYFNQRFGYQELNLLSLKDYVFWLAEYNPTPSFTYHFELWQYSNQGRIDGIDTDVDLNLGFLYE